MKNADGDPIQMLNIFVHDLKIVLTSLDINGDKTNEGLGAQSQQYRCALGCLKRAEKRTKMEKQ